MSRYPHPSDYRPSAARSRSPLRYPLDRRGSDAPPPRGPRTQQYDGARPAAAGGPGALSNRAPSYSSLRDAPPLTADRGRPFRARDFDGPPRDTFRDPRDYPRDLDVGRARRESRDLNSPGPESTPFPSSFRGGFGRGRGRGDFDGRRRAFEDRDVFRRERTPPMPPRFRDVSRDGRDPERRDDRREERREEERRPDWLDRERDQDRWRAPPRLETRHSNDLPVTGQSAHQQPAQALPIDPGRLALLEQAGADVSVRRPSVPQNAPAARESRPSLPETSSYLNSRAETTANRYNQRGSSPPTQAPPVPAFAFSFTASAAPTSFANSVPPSNPWRAPSDNKSEADTAVTVAADVPASAPEVRVAPVAAPPTAPKAPPPAPKALLAEPPPTAPKAPRALEAETSSFGSRLQGVRSLENLMVQDNHGTVSHGTPDAFVKPPAVGSTSVSAGARSALPSPSQPVSTDAQYSSRSELNPPTGPRAARVSPAQASISPRPPFASPRSDVGGFSGFTGASRGQTPPPSAPSGPRNRSYSVSPKVTSSIVPTAPKGIRAPPTAPRGADRGMVGPGRPSDRLAAPPPWAPPSAPRGSQWNQWRRPGVPNLSEKSVPVKRDFAGEEKDRQQETSVRDRAQLEAHVQESSTTSRAELDSRALRDTGASRPHAVRPHMMDVEVKPTLPVQPAKNSPVSGHSAAQSFFGKPVASTEEDDDQAMSDAADEALSSSDDDEIDLQEDLALFNAKFDRQKRALEAQTVDLSGRDYRATTPLESIARLARISEKDLQRLHDHQEMDLDGSPDGAEAQLMPPATTSSGSDEGPEILTPRGEERTAVEVRSSEDDSENARRLRRPSPEVISLPYLLKDSQQFEDNKVYRENIRQHEETKSAVLAALEMEVEDEEAAEADAEDEFQQSYRQWREECEGLDREREEQERLERQQSTEPGPEQDSSTALTANPVLEGRRLHKFNSQYELDLVIKQSQETARLEQERKDRESLKLQADMEKEARLPDQENEESFTHSIFIDTNRYREPSALAVVFTYEPPADTFTENEQQIFIAAFKETPKKWGEIASLLPGRSYKDCIHHYYANKWDGRFRDSRTKKLKATGRRGGRGGKAAPRGRTAAMADLGRNEELMPTSNVSDSGRPKRAAAPTTFGEREQDAKAALMGPSPARKQGASAKQEMNGEAGAERPIKRRKAMTEKTARKTKAQQPLAALAAAPTGSPIKRFSQATHPKEETFQTQNIEDASLMANMQSGHPGTFASDAQVLYHQESYASTLMPDDSGHSRVPGQAVSSKSNASSYWSVPEQQDFTKYIAHFGTDFAAIASHMGTKTQTMIKNHYHRQVESGSRPELQMAAMEANRRRENGEDMGPPPVPTPIIKRKYDNPQPPAQRPLAPHTDAMEIDEIAQPQRQPPTSKHASPVQYQPQPRLPISAQATPVQSARAVQSPAATAPSPTVSQTQAVAPPRQLQHPLGAGLAFFADSRPESRPGLQSTHSSYRQSQSSTPRAQSQSQPQQPSQMPDFIRSLIEEQERARRIEQQQQGPQQRFDQVQRPSMFGRGPSQGSPLSQPLQQLTERKPVVDERPPSPPRASYPAPSFSRPPFGQSAFASRGSTPLSTSLMGRSAFNPSPPNRTEPRIGSMSSSQPSQVPMASAPPAEPPKRSNLMSILNAEAEEPKPVKRESTGGASQRVASPAPPPFPSAPTPAPAPSLLPPRRETFGQPSMPQSQFHRSSLGQQGAPPGAAPPTLNRELSSGGPHAAQPRSDWPNRMNGQQPQQAQQSRPPSPPAFERDVRPYFHHRPSVLASLNQPTRAGPSPPPQSVIGHSRTPSLTAQNNQTSRDQRAPLPSQAQQHASLGPFQPLQPNPYAQAGSSSAFPQRQPPQSQNHAHHSQNSSLSGTFPGMHQRAPSREDMMRQHEYAAQRERDEYERRRQQEAIDLEHDRQAQFIAQRQHEERQQQQAFSRGPQPPHPFPGSSLSAQPGLTGGLRGQAIREAEAAVREEEQRRMQQHDAERWRHDNIMREREREQEEYRRRHEDALFGRRTPMGGFGHPPPPPRRQ